MSNACTGTLTWAYPKWIYRVPAVDFLHVFEMPLLGYIGYIPFSWELFALYHLIVKSLRGEAAIVQLCVE